MSFYEVSTKIIKLNLSSREVVNSKTQH